MPISGILCICYNCHDGHACIGLIKSHNHHLTVSGRFIWYSQAFHIVTHYGCRIKFSYRALRAVTETV